MFTNSISVDHELKTAQPFFERVWIGEKTFEVRKDDRDYQPGHVVRQREYSPESGYGDRWVLGYIGYVLRYEDFPEGIEPGYCVFGFLGVGRGRS